MLLSLLLFSMNGSFSSCLDISTKFPSRVIYRPHLCDAYRRITLTKWIVPRRFRPGSGNCFDNVLPTRTYQNIPPDLNRFYPLRLFTQRHTGNPEEKSLFLQPTRVGKYTIGSPCQSHHIEISHRLHQMDMFLPGNVIVFQAGT